MFNSESNQNVNNSGEQGDPKCRLFSTKVNCNVKPGSLVGLDETSAELCSLPANIFNQWFFIVLWFWWLILFICSVVIVFFRMTTFLVPNFARNMLTAELRLRGIYLDEFNMELTAPDCFFLGFVSYNVKRVELIKSLNEISGGLATENGYSKETANMALIFEEAVDDVKIEMEQ